MTQAYNTDCLAAMREMEDNQFDLAIVDPEYGIDAANMTMGRGSGNDTGKHKLKDWDKSIPPAGYFKEVKRVSINQIIWGGNYFLDYLGKCRGPIIWDKEDYNSDFADGEMAWTSIDKVLKIFKRARSKGGDSNNKIHPTQKPIALYKWLLKNYAKEGDTILDTHLGSGSSRIAAYDMGFDFTGYEIDKDYFDAQEKRFKHHIQQQSLFKPKDMY